MFYYLDVSLQLTKLPGETDIIRDQSVSLRHAGNDRLELHKFTMEIVWGQNQNGS